MPGGRPVLNVGAIEPRLRACGPGERFAIWVQGCERACPGCVNPEFQPMQGGRVITIGDLAHQILCVPNIDGVTYTGGEPMLQAGALVELSSMLRPAGLSVVCYTGYTLDHLRASNDPHVAQLLGMTDVLIDGPYVADLSACLLWRGSRNQVVHLLTDRYAEWGDRLGSECADVDLSVGGDDMTAVGMWPEDLLQRLREQMGK